MPSKQNTKAIDVWNKANTDMIRVRARKEERLNERIQLAIDRGIAKSRQAYILNAVRNALEKDGIPELTEHKDDE